MDKEDDILDAPEEVAPAARDAGYGYLVAGIFSWLGFVLCLTGLAPGSLGGICMIGGMLCGAYVLKSAPIRSAAGIHAAIGMSLWIGSFLLLHLFSIGR